LEHRETRASECWHRHLQLTQLRNDRFVS